MASAKSVIVAALAVFTVTTTTVALSGDVTYPPYPSQVTHDAAGRISDVSWRLAFAPPQLVNPLDVYVSNTNRRPSIPGDRDAIVHWPTTPVDPSGGDVQILGGHNVESVGGDICPTTSQRGLFLKGWTGTMYVEGLQIGGDGCTLWEGIDVDVLGHKGTRLVLQNVQVGSPSSPVHGSQSTNHADDLQAWDGPATLDIDRFTGYSEYQGFMLQPKQYGSWLDSDFGTWHFDRVGLHNTGAYVAYDTVANAPSIQCDDFWGDTTTADRVDYAGHMCGGVGTNFGAAPHGEFTEQPGIGYVSPGYLTP